MLYRFCVFFYRDVQSRRFQSGRTKNTANWPKVETARTDRTRKKKKKINSKSRRFSPRASTKIRNCVLFHQRPAQQSRNCIICANCTWFWEPMRTVLHYRHFFQKELFAPHDLLGKRQRPWSCLHFVLPIIEPMTYHQTVQEATSLPLDRLDGARQSHVTLILS